MKYLFKMVIHFYYKVIILLKLLLYETIALFDLLNNFFFFLDIDQHKVQFSPTIYFTRFAKPFLGVLSSKFCDFSCFLILERYLPIY